MKRIQYPVINIRHTAAVAFRNSKTTEKKSTYTVVAIDVEDVDDEDGAVHDQEEDGEVVGVDGRQQGLSQHGHTVYGENFTNVKGSYGSSYIKKTLDFRNLF